MTKTFERFLRTFTDEELIVFAEERSRVHPPYWRVMQLALRIEADRRGLRVDDDVAGIVSHDTPGHQTQTGTA